MAYSQSDPKNMHDKFYCSKLHFYLLITFNGTPFCADFISWFLFLLSLRATIYLIMVDNNFWSQLVLLVCIRSYLSLIFIMYVQYSLVLFLLHPFFLVTGRNYYEFQRFISLITNILI